MRHSFEPCGVTTICKPPPSLTFFGLASARNARICVSVRDIVGIQRPRFACYQQIYHHFRRIPTYRITRSRTNGNLIRLVFQPFQDRIGTVWRVLWCPRTDSNRRPADYKSAALPAELQGHERRDNCIASRSPDFRRPDSPCFEERPH